MLVELAVVVVVLVVVIAAATVVVVVAVAASGLLKRGILCMDLRVHSNQILMYVLVCVGDHMNYSFVAF